MNINSRLLPVVGLAAAVGFSGFSCKQTTDVPKGASELRAKVASGVNLSQSASELMQAAINQSDPEAARSALRKASKGLALLRQGFPSVKRLEADGRPQPGRQGGLVHSDRSAASQSGRNLPSARTNLDGARRGIKWMTRGVGAMRSALSAWNQNPQVARQKIRRGLKVFKLGLATLQGATKSNQKSACGCKSDGQCQDTGGGMAGSCGGGAPPSIEAGGSPNANRAGRGVKRGCGCGGRAADREASSGQCL